MSLQQNDSYYESQFESAITILERGEGLILPELKLKWLAIDFSIRLDAMKAFNQSESSFYNALK